jgi:hypothetical protein
MTTPTHPRPWLVLVAGPYRSGTGNDLERIRANLDRLEAAAMAVWERGHLPVIGEWLALPLMHRAGSRAPGDAVYTRFAYPVARRLIPCCDAVLRLPGASQGADDDTAQARALGLPVLSAVEDLPPAAGL